MGRRPRTVPGADGLLLVDKPAGISSAAVVAKARRIFGGVKAGHTGTLDPFATGLLPLALGEATKLAGYLTDSDKSYCGTIRFGVTTDTLDRTGTETGRVPVPPFDDAVLEGLAAAFRGEIVQVPPAFSAIKRDGRPMYELARLGEAPELEARPVRVDRLELHAAGTDTATITIDCSKGFYVRSLARDLGAALGCGAVLQELRRTRVGRLAVESSVTLETLAAMEDPATALVPLVDALAHLRLVEVAAEAALDLRQGRQRALGGLGSGRSGERVRVVCGSDLVAVAGMHEGLWKLERVFTQAARRSAAPCPPREFLLSAAVSQMEEEEKERSESRD
ncbi:MAG TPA: tRNA pseudouridine(55) synthase TruB [Candidatus Binatia bacterium]|jgi:tRNA pseudouridine55 synthase